MMRAQPLAQQAQQVINSYPVQQQAPVQQYVPMAVAQPMYAAQPQAQQPINITIANTNTNNN